MTKKLWGGRFSREQDRFAENFDASIHFDDRLARFDLVGSLAHAAMLRDTKILSSEEAQSILAGLRLLLKRLEGEGLEFRVEDEDIHLNLERLLIQEIGPVGGKLHTARSRNDQVALDVHLFVRAQVVETCSLLLGLVSALLGQAKDSGEAIMPGYTHTQRAQPVLFAHHMHAYACMFLRDLSRLKDLWKRANVSPLGAGALAGTTFPIDPANTAKRLGFDATYPNSMDAVSDRDFAVEYVSVVSSIMLHLSRICEEIVLWSSAEFGFIELDDAFSTGSSIMPQKKNADYAELIRGKTGRVYGSLISLLTTMKALPLTYNKDMQEDKEPVFDVCDTVNGSLEVARRMIATIRVRAAAMRKAAALGYANATDAADYLAKKGMPFREAHEIAGRMVGDCVQTGRELLELTLQEFKAYSPLFEQDIMGALALETVVNRRISFGGTGAPAVAAQLLETEKVVQAAQQWVEERQFCVYADEASVAGVGS